MKKIVLASIFFIVALLNLFIYDLYTRKIINGILILICLGILLWPYIKKFIGKKEESIIPKESEVISDEEEAIVEDEHA